MSRTYKDVMKDIVEEQLRNDLRLAELWEEYAEVGEFTDDEGRKIVLDMADACKEYAVKKIERLQKMKDA